MRKRLAVLLLAALLCVGLGGCRFMRHTRQEVQEYIGKSVKVSWLPEIELDKLFDWTGTWEWRCHFADMPEVTFHVSDDWLTGTYIIYGFTLSDDAEQVFWRYYLNQYVSEGVGSLDAWYIKETPSGHAYLEMDFHSMEQAYQAAEQFRAFDRWFNEQPHAAYDRQSYSRFQLDGLPLPLWNLTGSDSFGLWYTYSEGDPGDFLVARCAEMLKRYYAFYGLPSSEFTPEEMQAYATETWLWDSGECVQLDGESFPMSAFVGIGVKSHYISYGGFYEMLSRLDYEVEGTPEHFSFTGVDGCLYEFSYDFCDEAEGLTWWYFTCGGERLVSGSMSVSDGAPLLYLEDKRLQNMVGLEFVYG